MGDLANAIETLLRYNPTNTPCEQCLSNDKCGADDTWCINAIKAKVRGQNTWDPHNPIMEAKK